MIINYTDYIYLIFLVFFFIKYSLLYFSNILSINLYTDNEIKSCRVFTLLVDNLFVFLVINIEDKSCFIIMNQFENIMFIRLAL